MIQIIFYCILPVFASICKTFRFGMSENEARSERHTQDEQVHTRELLGRESSPDVQISRLQDRTTSHGT